MKTNKWATKLRKNTSPIEQKLWYHLRAKRLGGYKFRRQQAIGPFVVDFYCPQKRLVIELDGPSHGEKEQMKRDPLRQQFIEHKNITVLRYRNDQVMHDLETVLGDILKALNSL